MLRTIHTTVALLATLLRRTLAPVTPLATRAGIAIRRATSSIRRLPALARSPALRQTAATTVTTVAAVALLVAAMGGTWTTAAAAPGSSGTPTQIPGSAVTIPARIADAPDEPHPHASHKELTGKINLNTATEEQLMLLPSVGPAKADRIVAWRKKNGAFKRTADLRRVKGFGYKTFKRLEPFLDIKGDTTLAPK
ncbi:MAG: helix-hairpin-helix domain-containing protein [Deltaproteobacteria bacterium]|nr:helix-hairpin-helix domain-containing protein [Deltaproteobacteria bacterium]